MHTAPRPARASRRHSATARSLGAGGGELLGQAPGLIELPPRLGRPADLLVDLAQLLVRDRPAQVGCRPFGALRDVVEPLDGGVQQRPPRRAGRGRVAEPLLNVEDQVIEGVQRQVPLRHGCLLGRPGLGGGLAEPRVVVGDAPQDEDDGRRADAHGRGHGRPPPGPAPGLLPGGCGMCQDRLTRAEPAEVLGQVLGRGVAPAGRFLEALQTDRLGGPRQSRLEPRRRDRVAVTDLHERLHGRRRPERRPAGQELVEDGPQSVDVGRRADQPRVSLGLLRGHVAGRAEDRVGPGDRLSGVEHLGQTEVGHLGQQTRVEQDVGRLQVAMNDPLAVRLGDRARQRLDELRRGGSGPGGAVESLVEAAAGQVLELEVGEAADRADVVDLHDARVAEPGDRLGLAPEPRRGGRA